MQLNAFISKCSKPQLLVNTSGDALEAPAKFLQASLRIFSSGVHLSHCRAGNSHVARQGFTHSSTNFTSEVANKRPCQTHQWLPPSICNLLCKSELGAYIVGCWFACTVGCFVGSSVTTREFGMAFTVEWLQKC